MDKTLYLVGGTMGVGKTEACKRLNALLDKSVFLDGDWCWDMHPFQVTEETKEMALNNICFLLNSFLQCSAFENVVFCWVMHEQAIIDHILAQLDTSGWDVKAISLACSESALRSRLEGDIHRGVRTPDALERSVARMRLYDALDTYKIDTTDLSAEQVARTIATL